MTDLTNSSDETLLRRSAAGDEKPSWRFIAGGRPLFTASLCT